MQLVREDSYHTLDRDKTFLSLSISLISHPFYLPLLGSSDARQCEVNRVPYHSQGKVPKVVNKMGGVTLEPNGG